jgi:Trk-type K+ transport system membrane component
LALRHPIQHPARLVPLAFLIAVAVGTSLLLLPIARAGPGGAPLLIALFTATSAICVTGLAVVDVSTYWSGFGQAVILALFQVGGFGIMSGATLLALLVTRRLGLATRLIAQAETRSVALGDVAAVLRLILVVTVGVETLLAAILIPHLRFTYHEPWGQAVWHGVFHAVSAFNNAGLSTYPDSLVRFAADPLILVPIMAGVVLGGLGIPVLHELRQKPNNPARWSIHTKLTLLGSAILLFGGFAAVLAFEWGNPTTLGPHDPAGKLLGAMFYSAMTRSGGFNAFDMRQMQPETLTVSYVLMLIGGGSAGTAGGIRVTTFLLLGFVVLAEVRGEPDTTVFRRRIALDVQRQALTIVLLAVGSVAVGTLILLSVTDFALEDILFEAISAFATVGLSTGITPDLPPVGQFVVTVLMYMGRVGTITLATALALRSKQRPYRYPEERPIVG